MAIAQLVTTYINLKGDGAATTFVFALQNLYQFANGIAVPFGGSGVVPSSVTATNPPFPVTSSTIDANANITITLTSALGNGVVATFQLDLAYNSGASSATSPVQSSNSTLVSGSNTASINSSGVLSAGLPGAIQAISLTAIGQTQTINMLSYANTGIVITSLGVGGTLAVEVSIDNGVTWSGVDVWSEALEAYNNTQPVITATGSYWIEPIGAIWFTRVRVVALTSGTITGTMTATIAPNMNLEYTGQQGTTFPNNIAAVGGVFNSTQPNLATGQMSALQTSSTGTLNVNVNDVLTQPSVVQKVNATSSGSVASLQSAALASPTTVGNAIVVCVGYGSNGTITVSDTAGNVYKTAYVQNNGTTFGAAIFYAVNIARTTSLQVTVSTTTSSSLALQVYEVAGLLVSQVGIIGDRYGSTGSNPFPQTGMVTPQGPYSIAFQAIAIGTSAETVTTTGQGWTLDSTQNPTTPSGLFTLVSESSIAGSMGTSTSLYNNFSNATFTLSAVAASSGGTAVYTGTITGGGSNAFAGFAFTITGFAAANNNGTYVCTASTTTTLTLTNANASAVSTAATATPSQVATGNSILSGSNAYAAVTVTFRNPPLAVQGVVSLVDGSRFTYRAAWSAATPVAGVLVALRGSDTKLVRVTRAKFGGYTAATGGNTVITMERVTIGTTAGTPVTPAVTKCDPNDPPNTAVLSTYFGGVPTAATVSVIDAQSMTIPTTAVTAIDPYMDITFSTANGTKQPVLRGSGDYFAIRTSAVGTTPTAFCSGFIEWTEE